GQLRWPRFAIEQRTERPIGLTGRRRPADVIQSDRRGRRVLPTLDFFDALAGLAQRELGPDADLLPLLLTKLRHLSRGAVVVRRPELGFEAVWIAGFRHQ